MYERFFGLTDRPFEVTPDSKFLFLSANYLAVMNALFSGIRDRKGLMVVIGEVGTGKTILVHSVLERLEEGVKSAFIFHTTVTFKELLRAILLELEQPAPKEDEKVLWEQVVQYSKQVFAQEGTLAMIIDEAHKLDQDVIDKLLQRMIEPRSRHIQMILVGQPELEEKLESSAVSRFGRSGMDRRKFSVPAYSPEKRSGQDRRGRLRERMEVWLEIKPLTDEESKRYIEHRLRLCGGKTSELFTEQAVNLLSHQAQGIPRVLNILCDNALLTAYGLSKQKIDVDVVHEAIRALEGIRKKKVLAFLHSPQTAGMQAPLWKVLLVGLLLLCLAGFLVWLDRDSGQPGLGTSEKGFTPTTASEASLPAVAPKTEQKLEVTNKPPAALVETGTLASQTLSSISLPATSSTGKRGQVELKEVVAVKAGENVFSLCRRHYGFTNATLMDIVLDFNPGLANAHLVAVNQKIRLPRVTEELLILENPDQSFQIHAGTFADPGASRRYSNLSVLKGKDIQVIPRKVSPEDTWYRVVIGIFDHRDDALKMVRFLKGRGLVPLSKIGSGEEVAGTPGLP